MTGAYDDDDVPLQRLQEAARARASARPGPLAEPEEQEERAAAPKVGEGDRLRPAASGALVGLVAGAAALGVVHLLAPQALEHAVARAAAARHVDLEASFAIAYATAGACGALAGSVFAVVTRYLRRMLPLLVWALVFFLSVTLVVLSVWRTSDPRLAPAILAATAVYAVLASLALPLRKR